MLLRRKRVVTIIWLAIACQHSAPGFAQVGPNYDIMRSPAEFSAVEGQLESLRKKYNFTLQQINSISRHLGLPSNATAAQIVDEIVRRSRLLVEARNTLRTARAEVRMIPQRAERELAESTLKRAESAFDNGDFATAQNEVVKLYSLKSSELRETRNIWTSAVLLNARLSFAQGKDADGRAILKQAQESNLKSVADDNFKLFISELQSYQNTQFSVDAERLLREGLSRADEGLKALVSLTSAPQDNVARVRYHAHRLRDILSNWDSQITQASLVDDIANLSADFERIGGIELANYLTRQSVFLHSSGNDTQARLNIDRAIGIYKNNGDTEGQGYALWGLSNFYGFPVNSNRPNYELALKTLNDAIPLLESSNSGFVLSAKINRAVIQSTIAQSSGDLAAAEKFLSTISNYIDENDCVTYPVSCAGFTRIRAVQYNNISARYQRLGDRDNSIKFLNLSTTDYKSIYNFLEPENGRSDLWARSTESLGYSLTQYSVLGADLQLLPEAARYLREALTFYENRKMDWRSLSTRLGLARNLFEQLATCRGYAVGKEAKEIYLRSLKELPPRAPLGVSENEYNNLFVTTDRIALLAAQVKKCPEYPVS